MGFPLKSDSDAEDFVALVPNAMHRPTDAEEPEDTIAQRPSRMHRSAGSAWHHDH
jgi:hypothetical protein